jgi:hypothetical protein
MFLPLKGRENVMFLPLQALNLIWYRARGRLGGGWGFLGAV